MSISVAVGANPTWSRVGQEVAVMEKKGVRGVCESCIEEVTGIPAREQNKAIYFLSAVVDFDFEAIGKMLGGMKVPWTDRERRSVANSVVAVKMVALKAVAIGTEESRRASVMNPAVFGTDYPFVIAVEKIPAASMLLSLEQASAILYPSESPISTRCRCLQAIVESH